MTFLGEYEVTMDAKGRFSVPVGFRKQLSEGEEVLGFVVCRGMDGCLSFYTKSEFEVYAGKLNQLNEFNPKAQMLKRVLLSGATLLQLDTAGRVLLPKQLIEYAQLGKTVIFAAQGKKVEIWDKDKYNQYLMDVAANMGDLANEVLGNNFMDPFNNVI